MFKNVQNLILTLTYKKKVLQDCFKIQKCLKKYQ